MTDAHHARRSRRLVGVVLAAAVALVVPLTVVSSAQGAPGGGGKPDASGGDAAPTATKIRIVSVLDEDAILPTSTPGIAGLAYVVAGDDFTVTVEFLDAAGRPAPLSWNRDIDLELLIEGTRADTVTVEAAQPGGSFPDQQLAVPATGVSMTVEAATKPRPLTDSRTFDVLIADEPVNVSARTSIGGSGGTEGCNPTAPETSKPAVSVCADLLPPVDRSFSPGTLSQGLCLADCEGSFIQALVGFPADPMNPATLIMKCDKDECGVGPIRRQDLVVNLSPEGTGYFNKDVPAGPCPSKGTVGPWDPNKALAPGNAPFCVDYVQSTRSNAGDTFLFLLFTLDAKVRFS